MLKQIQKNVTRRWLQTVPKKTRMDWLAAKIKKTLAHKRHEVVTRFYKNKRRNK